MKIWLTASEFNWQFNWMFEHRQMQQSDNTKPTFFLCKKETRAKCAKNYDINCDSWLSNCVFLSNFKDTSTGLIVVGKGKFRK